MGRGQQSHGTQRRKQGRAKDRAKDKSDKKHGGSGADAGAGSPQTTPQQGWNDGTGLLGLLGGWIIIMIVVGFTMGGRSNITTQKIPTNPSVSNIKNAGAALEKTATLSADTLRDTANRGSQNRRTTQPTKSYQNLKSQDTLPQGGSSFSASVSNPWFDKLSTSLLEGDAIKCGFMGGFGKCKSIVLGSTVTPTATTATYEATEGTWVKDICGGIGLTSEQREGGMWECFEGERKVGTVEYDGVELEEGKKGKIGKVGEEGIVEIKVKGI
ncbi:hypothetical protein TrCOL_g543 [Triparma columacea]|uniref:Uncharacterized protein n=1 Tax=Triparma columacea TaxID=722753 RepID=A0A9W7GNQ0_9STRA|nr:hypothetical protein TrCOL_g543 [Triparma columacea]